ncbi:MAG: CDP-diacylglycerol--glycerol-3-phosphate 3-phosphatidyltransferase [Actinomycetota bacterium]
MNDQTTRSTGLLLRITFMRIVLVPAIMALVLAGDRLSHAYVTAAVLFAFAAGTDFVDGYLARRWAVTSTLGSFLDTTADKLLVTGTLVTLVQVDRASPWIAAIIIGRELVILGLRGLVAADGVVMEPSIWGKLKANAQFLAIGLAIVRVSEPLGAFFIDEWAMFAAAAITLMSAWDYLARWSTVLSSPGSQ